MNDWKFFQEQQKALCDKMKVEWIPLEINSLIAINDSLFSKTKPVNGLRHPNHGDIHGWYLWSGNKIPSNDNNFFKPIHLEHLIESRPLVLKYLGLPAGWRFQIDDEGYEDIWFDQTILKI